MNPCPKHPGRFEDGCVACIYERDPRQAPWTPEMNKIAEDAVREWKEVGMTAYRRIAEFNDDITEQLDIAIFKEQK